MCSVLHCQPLGIVAMFLERAFLVIRIMGEPTIDALVGMGTLVAWGGGKSQRGGLGGGSAAGCQGTMMLDVVGSGTHDT